MKRLLSTILLVTMFTPILLCGMSFCPVEAQAAEPCHEQEQSIDDSLMTVYDCMNVDLFSPDSPQLTDVDQDYEQVVYVVTLNNHIFLNDYSNTNDVADPPPWVNNANFKPSIIINTQRFRI